MKRKSGFIVILFLLVLALQSSVFASVSYLGPAGTYTEEASVLFFGEAETIIPTGTVNDALSMVKKGESKYAVVPVENTIGGPVYNYLDAVINDPDFAVIGEVNLPIRQTLLVLPGTRLEDIKTIMSHPQGIAQSKDWLKANLPQAKIVEVSSTAEAARNVAETGDKSVAAIAASRTAGVYHLAILANDLQYTDTNVTRFWVVTLKKNQTLGAQKAAVIVRGPVEGLAKVIAQLDKKGFNVVSLHDRPAKTKLGEYIYVLELSGGNMNELTQIVNTYQPLLEIKVKGIFDGK